MTPEMINLEFAHILLDQQLKDANKELFEDPDYEDYDQEEESAEDSEDQQPLSQINTNVEWEDIDVEDA